MHSMKTDGNDAPRAPPSSPPRRFSVLEIVPPSPSSSDDNEGGDASHASPTIPAADAPTTSTPAAMDVEPTTTSPLRPIPLASTAIRTTTVLPTASPPPFPPKPSPLLHIDPDRESYLRRYLGRDEYPVSLQTRIEAFLGHRRHPNFHGGEFVEVRARLLPGEQKFGGLGPKVG